MKDLAIGLAQTLLIADADVELCDLYRQFFMKHGYEVETCSDGLDCLSKLRTMGPAVLVLDLEIRWGGGDGILACLREADSAHEFPVILTSTAADPRAFACRIEPPVVDCLPKPFALTGLLEKVRCAIAKKIPQALSNHHRVCPELFVG